MIRVNERVLESALGYAKLGLSVIPLAPGRKHPPKDVTWKDRRTKRAMPEEIKEWWATNPDAQIGIVTGKISNLVAIDIDSSGALKALERKFGKLPESIYQHTGRENGRHALFKYPNGHELRNSSNKIDGIDIRAEGGIIVVPPSLHKSGRRYRWGEIDPLKDGLAKMADLPDNIIEFFSNNTDCGNNSTRKNFDPSNILDGVPEGERDERLFKEACRLQAKGLTRMETEAIILTAARNCRPPFPEKEALKKIDSAWKYSNGDVDILEVVREMNKKHAVVMVGGKCRILNETIDPVFNRPDITLSSISDLHAFYSNKKIQNSSSGNQINISKVWLDSTRRREYDGIVFSPGRDIPGYYNLFKGFPIEPKKGDWSRFEDHILEIIAGGHPERARWIMAWMARIVQDPGGERPGVSIVMRGKRGTGKGIFANNFGAIFGNHFLSIANSHQVIGRFNSHLKDCLLLFIDEGFWAGDKSAEGVLKSIITEPHINIEQKGQDIFKTKNNINIIIASNSDWIVPAGLEERRFSFHDVSDERIQDHPYFKSIIDQMENGGREAMLYDLLRMDISAVDLRTFERTSGLFDQILSTMSTVEKFWFEKLKKGVLFEFEVNALNEIVPIDHTASGEEWFGEVPIKTLFMEYSHFAKSINERYPGCPEQFSKKLTKLCKGTKTSRVTIYGKRTRIRVFPPLDECRKQFEELVQMPIDWED